MNFPRSDCDKTTNKSVDPRSDQSRVSLCLAILVAVVICAFSITALAHTRRIARTAQTPKSAQAPRAKQPAAATGGLLYIGTWPKVLLVIDEARGTIIDKIELQTGTPRSLKLSYDKKKIYVTTMGNGIEVIDTTIRKVVNSFDLDEGNRITRVSSIAPDPQDKLLYATIRTVIKQVDRFEVEKPKFAVVDLEQKKIVKTFDFPKEYDTPRGFIADYRVSPDGKLLYVFKEDILIFDLKDFKQIDKIELSKPLHPGHYPIRLGASDDPVQEPGVVTSVFNTVDPVVQRPIFGIARLDLSSRSVDYTPIGPATTAMTGLHLTPDRKTGYTVASFGTGGNRRTEFWVFDIPARKLVNKVEFASRTRFSFALSSDGSQCYIYVAGPTIETYDTTTFKLKNVLTLEGDSTTQLLVVRKQN